MTAVNTFGANGLLARHTMGTGGRSVFYTFDQQGSTVQRLDSAGNVLSAHGFDAFGTSLTANAAPADPYAGYGAQWGYRADAETGLLLLGQRYYDPASGRFLNRDPAGYQGGIDLYGYCGDEPAGGIDSNGLAGSGNFKGERGWGSGKGDDPLYGETADELQKRLRRWQKGVEQEGVDKDGRPWRRNVTYEELQRIWKHRRNDERRKNNPFCEGPVRVHVPIHAGDHWWQSDWARYGADAIIIVGGGIVLVGGAIIIVGALPASGIVLIGAAVL